LTQKQKNPAAMWIVLTLASPKTDSMRRSLAESTTQYCCGRKHNARRFGHGRPGKSVGSIHQAEMVPPHREVRGVDHEVPISGRGIARNTRRWGGEFARSFACARTKP